MANAGAQIHFWGQSGEKSELSLGKAVRILKAWEDGSALMFLPTSNMCSRPFTKGCDSRFLVISAQVGVTY